MKKNFTRILTLPVALILLSACANRQLSPAETETAPLSPIHPGFTLSAEDLKVMIENLPEEVRSNIIERPEYFLELMKKLLDLPENLLLLVNQESSLDAGYEPEDLINLDDYGSSLTLSRKGHRIRQVMMPSLLAMSEAARQEGIDLMISSAYRSYNYQKGLYDRYVARDGQEEADRYSARPGTSQHQLGMAIDFGSIDESFALSPEGIWLKNNASAFGFSLSYPEGMEELTGYMWESWHYRYIGTAAAEMETEFFAGVQERMLRFIHSYRDSFKNSRI